MLVKTNLDGIFIVRPPTFKDHRGWFVESYNVDEYKSWGIDHQFVQDNFSFSHKNVLRGLHGDRETWKLMSCVQGSVYIVVVDARSDQLTFGKWVNLSLSDEDYFQILVAPGFANGCLTLSTRSIIHYKQSTYYNPSTQFTLPWNDPRFGIDWPVTNPILSDRDDG